MHGKVIAARPASGVRSDRLPAPFGLRFSAPHDVVPPVAPSRAFPCVLSSLCTRQASLADAAAYRTCRHPAGFPGI